MLAFSFEFNSLPTSRYLLTLFFMKKQDLIKTMATTAGLSQDAAAKALKAFIDVTTKALKKGDTWDYWFRYFPCCSPKGSNGC